VNERSPFHQSGNVGIERFREAIAALGERFTSVTHTVRPAIRGRRSHPWLTLFASIGRRREGGRDKERWLAQFGNPKLSVETGAQ
jgi:hypothetical protein